MHDLILSPHCHTQDGTITTHGAVRPAGSTVSVLADALADKEATRLLIREGHEGLVMVNIKRVGVVNGRAIPAFATDQDMARYQEAVN